MIVTYLRWLTPPYGRHILKYTILGCHTQIRPEQFNGVPSRKYDLYGTIIKVPDNYDPESRTYSGLWTGNFKTAYTNNPAWVIYDLITNNRYGLRNYYPNLAVDKFTMYSVGQYCDQLIDDGFGGKEPRFTCNCYLTDQRQAWEVISDFYSIFRAIPVWTGQQLSVVIDRPADVTNIYTNANVVDGKFNYISSAKKDRFTAVTVKYVDPSNGWKTSTEFISDDAMIRRFGYNIKNVDAFACTSRSQARRLGLWILETSRLEKQSVTFSIARDGLRHLPGDIIGIADSDYAGAVIGGRIKEVDGNTITLDRDVEITDVNDTKFSCVDNTTGKLVEMKVTAHPEKNKLVLDNNAVVNQWSVWSISTSKVKPRLFKALSITENIENPGVIHRAQRVIVENPFPNRPVFALAQVRINGSWGDSGHWNQHFTSGNMTGWFVHASQLSDGIWRDIIVQSGSEGVAGCAEQSGAPHTHTESYQSAQYRVLVWRIINAS